MSFIMNILGSLAGFYMLLIFIRVMISWFGGANLGRPAEILTQITDPYLNWWRKFPMFRTGYIDLSPVAGMAVLSLVQTVCNTTARYGRMSMGTLLAIVLQAAWSVISFVLGFFIIVLVLRFFAYLTNRNIYSAFWRIIDSISQPVLYRITRIFFRRRLINYMAGVLLSIGTLAVLFIGGSLLVSLLLGFLTRLPL
ncbi:MAG: YggT family protein [Treponema sp.]|jgi:YggT family protein|nr:YggT family protein [Treponema sp.]